MVVGNSGCSGGWNVDHVAVELTAIKEEKKLESDIQYPVQHICAGCYWMEIRIHVCTIVLKENCIKCKYVEWYNSSSYCLLGGVDMQRRKFLLERISITFLCIVYNICSIHICFMCGFLFVFYYCDFQCLLYTRSLFVGIFITIKWKWLVLVHVSIISCLLFLWRTLKMFGGGEG